MFQVQSQIESISTRKDRTLKIVVGTQELSPEQASEVMRLSMLTGWFLFKEDVIQEVDVPKGNTEEVAKTQSQRLRAVLFVYWKQKGGDNDFEGFYRRQMEKIINKIKGELI